MKLYLIPRLNYNFSFRDLGISIIGAFRYNFNKIKISELFNNKDIYFVNHARTGLRLLLNSFNLPQNARIGVQILNCHTVFNAIIKAGYTPILIDINESLTISLDDLKRKVTQIDALIVTHLFGIPAEIEKIIEIAKGKPIIEDCAHSFLSKRNGKIIGTIGDAAIFSFGKAKFPSIGSGGFVIINNKMIIPKFIEYFSKLKGDTYFAEIKNIIESLIFKIIYYRFIYVLFKRLTKSTIMSKISIKIELNHNYETAEKKVLRSNLSLFLNKMNEYESYKEKQVTNAWQLKKYLTQYKNLEQIKIDIKSNPNYIMLPVLTNNKKELINSFFKKGVEIGSHFSKSIEWAEELGYKKNDCLIAESIIPKLILFPTYTSIRFK